MPGARYTVGEEQPRKERYRSAESKKQRKGQCNQPAVLKVHQQEQTHDHKQTVLLIQAGRLMIGQNPDQNKLIKAGWTVEDAKAKAEEIKQKR